MQVPQGAGGAAPETEPRFSACLRVADREPAMQMREPAVAGGARPATGVSRPCRWRHVFIFKRHGLVQPTA